MIAEPGQYKKAVELMADLRRKGVECGETHGGIRIFPNSDDQRKIAEDVCKRLDVHFHDGGQTYAQDFRDAMREENREGAASGSKSQWKKLYRGPLMG